MKNLYLLRHANTQPNTGDDKARILTPKGVKEVQSIANQILSAKYDFDIVLCSTAVRTKQTLHHLESFLDKELYTEYKESLYNPSLNDFIDTIKNTRDHFANAIIISHNPTTSEAANYLIGENKLSFGTANLAILELDIKNWSQLTQRCAQLKQLLKP